MKAALFAVRCKRLFDVALDCQLLLPAIRFCSSNHPCVASTATTTKLSHRIDIIVRGRAWEGRGAMIDWEYSDDGCPKCHNQLAWQRCTDCGGDGYVEEDDDDILNDAKCDACNGKGYQEWCRECGWDETYQCFLSPQYKSDWLAKQEALSYENTVRRHQAASGTASIVTFTPSASNLRINFVRCTSTLRRSK